MPPLRDLAHINSRFTLCPFQYIDAADLLIAEIVNTFDKGFYALRRPVVFFLQNEHHCRIAGGMKKLAVPAVLVAKRKLQAESTTCTEF